MAIKYQSIKSEDQHIHQCDIFKKVPFYEKYFEENGGFELSVLEFPLAIILTQECDLTQNKNERLKIGDIGHDKIKHDKFLVSLLCAPLYNAEQLFSGNHLENLKIDTEKKSTDQKNYIRSNREPRYHYIEFDEESEIVPSIIDFKHYFSISLPYLENKLSHRVCTIKPIFRESISQRFSNYLSRIGLPEHN